jgi:amidophosphoribosyltransferase
MPSRTELVAFNRDTSSIAEAIGADLVIFQTLEDLVESVRQLNPSIKTFESSVFTGKYVTGGVDEEYLEGLEKTRADNVRIGKGVKPNGINTSSGLDGGKEGVVLASGPMSGGDDTVGLHNSWKRP